MGTKPAVRKEDHDPNKEGTVQLLEKAKICSHFCLSFLLDVQIFLTYMLQKVKKKHMLFLLWWLKSLINFQR